MKFTEHTLENGIIVIRYDSRDWLCVGPSAALASIHVQGDGLYALRDFKKGDIIGRYTGALVSETALKTYSDDTYLVTLGPFIVDGSLAVQKAATQIEISGRICFEDPWIEANKTYMHKMNDPQDTGAVENVRVLPDGSAVALYNIPKYTELLWSYGKTYWQGRQHSLQHQSQSRSHSLSRSPNNPHKRSMLCELDKQDQRDNHTEDTCSTKTLED